MARRYLFAFFLVAAAGPFGTIGCSGERAAPLQTHTPSPTTRANNDFTADPAPVSAAEREESLRRLDTAIQAHGGAAALAKMQTMIVNMEGTLNNAFYQNELKLRFPDYLRLSGIGSNGTQKIPFVLCVQPKGAWRASQGKREEITEPVQIADARKDLYVLGIFTLTPLKDEKFILRPLPMRTFSKGPALGIKIEQKERPTVGLYFDTQTNLLVRMEIPRWREAGQVQWRVISYHEHEKTDELMLPRVWKDDRDDRTFGYWAKVTYQFPKQIDDKAFEEP